MEALSNSFLLFSFFSRTATAGVGAHGTAAAVMLRLMVVVASSQAVAVAKMLVGCGSNKKKLTPTLKLLMPRVLGCSPL